MRKRWRRLIGPGFFLLLLLGVSFAIACSSTTPEEKITKAKEELKQSVVEGKGDPIHDNGKNFLLVQGEDLVKAMLVLQKWVDTHPDKEIGGMSINGETHSHYANGWLVYYRDKENCPLTSTK